LGSFICNLSKPLKTFQISVTYRTALFIAGFWKISYQFTGDSDWNSVKTFFKNGRVVLSNHSSGLDVVLLKMIMRPTFTRQTFTVQDVLYEPLNGSDERELVENVEFIIPNVTPLSKSLDIETAKEDSRNLESLRKWAVESNAGPIMVLFENARSNNSCILGMNHQLRGDLYKHYMRTKEHIPMVEISYRDNQYITPVNTTSSFGLVGHLKLLMNPVNYVRVKFGVLEDINLSTMDSILNGLRNFYTQDKDVYMTDRNYKDYQEFIEYWNQTNGKISYIKKTN